METLTWPAAVAILGTIITICLGLLGITKVLKKDDSEIKLELSKVNSSVGIIKEKIESEDDKLAALDNKLSEHDARDQKSFDRIDSRIEKLIDSLVDSLKD